MSIIQSANTRLLFGPAEQQAMHRALCDGYQISPAHTLAAITSYNETHQQWILNQPKAPDTTPLKLRDWSELPTADEFSRRAHEAVLKYTELYDRYVNDPLRLTVDTSILYDHHKTRDDALPNWDGLGELPGWEAYQARYSGRKNSGELPPPGRGFQLIQRLMQLNQQTPDSSQVRVDLVSRRPPKSTERIMRALRQDFSIYLENGLTRFSYGQNHPVNVLQPKRAGGPLPNLWNHKPHIALLSTPYWASQAVQMGLSAFYLQAHDIQLLQKEFLKFVFDCDGVIIDDWSEREFHRFDDPALNLAAFNQHEEENVNVLPNLGPAFISLLGAYGLRHRLHLSGHAQAFRLGINTARGGIGQTRILSSLVLMGLADIDDLEQMSGEPKGPLLASGGADIHFDDGPKHARKAFDHGVLGAHLISGVQNEELIRTLEARGY